jgi:beta-glucosidase
MIDKKINSKLRGFPMKKYIYKISPIILIFLLSLFFSCTDTEERVKVEFEYDFQNPFLSAETRIADLITRMTLEEKISQLTNNSSAIERLGIPEYDWWNECLHGVARAGRATVFPQAIGLSATWNTDLIYKTADVISTEARAKHHEAVRNDDRARYKGLTFWTPNINIFRDPRWGRGQETYGEDPYLTSRIGVAFVKGLQGDDPKYLKAAGCAKHFAVHSGPEPLRHEFDITVSDRDLWETYLPAFEALVKEAEVEAVMCAYNRYDGEACCGSDRLLIDILRNQWGFGGHIVSDCWAVVDIYQNHKIVETAPEAAAIALKSGTDVNCGSTFPSLKDAAKMGLVSEKDIDRALINLLNTRFKLGMLDPPEMVKYAQIPCSENDTEAHRQLSLRVAQESIVLLKNEDNRLPLKKDLNKIAVIGPTADSYEMLLGNYSGTPSKYVTPLQGIKNKISDKTKVVFEQGVNLAKGGVIKHTLSSRMLNSDGRKGLKLECFKNTDMTGEPFFTKVDEIPRTENWVWGAGIPDLSRESELSLRWSGTVNVPETGDYKLTVKGNGNYQLVIDDNVLVENFNDNPGSNGNNHMHLEKDKAYSFKLEYFKKQGFPGLSVEWELLGIDHFKHALNLAADADVIIYVGGLTAQLEGEEMPVDYEGFKGGDRTNIKLPGVQLGLLKALHSTGKPVVLVITSGSALAVNWANENIPAIVQLWYPGQEGGTALADVLFGDYNPAGRLPVTFYKSVGQLPPFEDYNMKGRTYRYFEDEPLYAFGYGLSYSDFEYSNMSITPEKLGKGDNISVSVEVKNNSQVNGDEVVQVYITDNESDYPVPVKSLKAFKRIHLKAGQREKVKFDLKPDDFGLYDDAMNRVIEPGTFTVMVGGSSSGGLKTTVTAEKQIIID